VASVRASGYLSPSSLAPILGLLPPHSCRAGGGPVPEATVSTAVFFAPLARVRAKFGSLPSDVTRTSRHGVQAAHINQVSIKRIV
jgi:hypothetical protein